MEKRVIEVSGKYLRSLNKSGDVVAWVNDNQDIFEKHVAGYDELSASLNAVSDESPLLEIMPKTKKLKSVMGGRDIPDLDAMSDGNFGHALMEARGPMVHGQKIKAKEIENPTPDDKSFAIGTPSMDTTPEALAVGTAGHLIERTFFQWARKNNIEPEGGWKKDDFLQALDEGLLLSLANGETPHLTPYFVNSNPNGGLGWLNEVKIVAFNEKLSALK